MTVWEKPQWTYSAVHRVKYGCRPDHGGVFTCRVFFNISGTNWLQGGWRCQPHLYMNMYTHACIFLHLYKTHIGVLFVLILYFSAIINLFVSRLSSGSHIRSNLMQCCSCSNRNWLFYIGLRFMLGLHLTSRASISYKQKDLHVLLWQVSFYG